MGSFYMDINNRFVSRYKESCHMMTMEKREDEAMGGDGVVTMRHMKKN